MKTQLIPKSSNKNKSLFYLFLLMVVFSLIMLLLMLGIRSDVNKISREVGKEVKTFVQFTDGTTDLVESRPSWYRTDAVLRVVVEKWIRFTYEWDNSFNDPNADPDPNPTGLERRKTDPGIDIGSNAKIPTRAYVGGFLLENDFREAFLEKLVDQVPPNFFNTKGLSVEGIVEIYEMSTPRQINQGVWELDVVAVLIEKTPFGETSTRYNRTFTLESRHIPEALFEPNRDPSLLRQRVLELGKLGVMITDIQELDL